MILAAGTSVCHSQIVSWSSGRNDDDQPRRTWFG
jgi:hypothetical protein